MAVGVVVPFRIDWTTGKRRSEKKLRGKIRSNHRLMKLYRHRLKRLALDELVSFITTGPCRRMSQEERSQFPKNNIYIKSENRPGWISYVLVDKGLIQDVEVHLVSNNIIWGVWL